jgi:riboflavin kinase/FMN adenylyltransferase
MKYVLAMGLFDGVHRGHQAILVETKSFAKEKGAVPAVLTFDTLPKASIAAGPGRITDFETQKYLFTLYGIDSVFLLSFTDEIRNLTPEEFVSYLQNQLGAVGVVVGSDFRFGKNRAGDACFLQSRIESRIVAPVVSHDGAAVSSTAIRALLSKGEMEAAEKLLGHSYVRVAKVQKGAARGRGLGFATVNLPHEDSLLKLPPGVYAAYLTLEDGVARPGVTNFGYSPTFGNGTEYRSETHVFDFSQEVYGQTAKLEVVSFLRPELKFSAAEELIAQMEIDAERARARLAERLR